MVQYADSELCGKSICCHREVLKPHAVLLTASMQTSTFKLSRTSGTLPVLPDQTVYYIRIVSGVHRCIPIVIYRLIHHIMQYADSALCGKSICCFRKGQEEHTVRLSVNMRSMTQVIQDPRILLFLPNEMFYYTSAHRYIHMVTLYQVARYAGSALYRKSKCCLRKVLEEHTVRIAKTVHDE